MISNSPITNATKISAIKELWRIYYEQNQNCPRCNAIIKPNKPWYCTFCRTDLYSIGAIPAPLIEVIKLIEEATPRKVRRIVDEWTMKLRQEL